MVFSRALKLALFLTIVLPTLPSVAADDAVFPGSKSKWHGFDMFKDKGTMIVVPDKVAEGKPWIWRARFWGHEPQLDIALLKKGYHVVYCDVGNLYGAPAAVKRWDDFYKYLHEDHGFAKKAVLEGMSRGGLIIYNWGIANPEKVSVIYGDAPVMDFKSWPGHANNGILKAYGFKSADEAKAYKGNPVDNLMPLAKAGVRIIHVVGDADKVVPVSENTSIAEKRYKEFGGVFEVIHKENVGHHPHSLKDPQPLVDFILKHNEITKSPAPKKPTPKKQTRRQPPTRPFDGPGAPTFTRLDGKPGVNPPADVNGNFLIGPKYVPAPERKAVQGVPQGKVQQFTIDSKDTKLFNPGIARKVFGKVDPKNPKTLIVETHEVDYKRMITVYIPSQYVPGNASPFIVIHDGPKGKPNMDLPHIFDNLIAQKRIPPMIAIMMANGGGDAQGHERGKEYDTMSGAFAEYIETEVLPRVEKNCMVKLTKDPDGRAAMGSSSGGSCALIMAWYRPDLYHRVLTTSGTFVNQQWPFDPKTPNGAWDFHETLIPQSDRKPLRIFLSVGDRDLLNPNVMRDGMHDWVEANHRMAKVLKAKGYPYQYLYCLNVGHGIGPAKAQFLPHALEWLWKDYPAKKTK